MNSAWNQNRRQVSARQGTPTPEIWQETEPFLQSGVMDQEMSYPTQFEGASFTTTRPTHQSSSQYGYRGRPTSQPHPYMASMGNVQRDGDILASPFEPIRTSNHPRQWGAPNNQASRPSDSQALEEPQDGFRREIARLNHRLTSVQDELRKDRELNEKHNGELEKKWNDLEEKFVKHGNLKDILTTVEEKYTNL